MNKKWWLCFLVLGMLGMRLQDLLPEPPCSLNQCLIAQPGRYVVRSARPNLTETALLARGEKLHRHGDFLVYQTGPESLRHVLEVGEAEAIASTVAQANGSIRLSLGPTPYHPFECLRDSRGCVVGLRRAPVAVNTSALDFDSPQGGLDLHEIARDLHPGLVGWWSGPDDFARTVLSARYQSYFEPVHTEVHRAERVSTNREREKFALTLRPSHPECGPHCPYRSQTPWAGELPEELFRPDSHCLVILGGLQDTSVRLLRARGEQCRQHGPILLLERRGEATVESLIRAAELETLQARVTSWNNLALMNRGQAGVREYLIRYGASGDAAGLVLGERVVHATANLTGIGERQGCPALQPLAVLCPALAPGWCERWDLPSRYEPLVQDVRERARLTTSPGE